MRHEDTTRKSNSSADGCRARKDPEDAGCSASPGLSQALEQTIKAATRIARNARGTGALFIVGDSERVLASSRCAILDPLLRHPARSKRVDDPGFRGTLNELARLRGAFVVSEEGVVVSAARCMNAPKGPSANLPGSSGPHPIAAYVSRETGAVVVAVSGTRWCGCSTMERSSRSLRPDHGNPDYGKGAKGDVG